MKKTMQINKTEELLKSNQKYLNWFVFFSLFPLIKIAGISITFFIFIAYCYILIKNKIKIFKIETKTDIILLTFLFFLILSSLFAEETARDRSYFSLFKLTIQYIYWVIVALHIKTWIEKYDYLEISKFVFYAVVVSTLYYITINRFYVVFYPNEFAFTIVLALPLAFYYMIKKFSNTQLVLVISFILLGIFWSESRTGLALVLFELVLLIYINNSKVRIVSVFFILLVVPLVYLTYSIVDLQKEDIKNIKYEISDIVEDISPKFAYTLRLEQNVLERDKSFLIRKLMIQKGEQIFEEHPFLGIGIGNFTYYSVDLDMTQASHWLKRGEERYNKVSSQNTYLKIITETGIITSFFLLLIFIILIIYGLKYLIVIKDQVKLFIFVSFLSLIIYGFILVTIQGAKFWILLGLTMAIIDNKKEIT
ncbi:MAG: hypothetical protein CL623_11840 [Arcobacter sp.]|nr:hypothetical protein [Arcobacter sp.]